MVLFWATLSEAKTLSDMMIRGEGIKKEVGEERKKERKKYESNLSINNQPGNPLV
jgi:hypothetical protein